MSASLKVLLVNPNISESVSELILAEAKRAASPGTHCDVVTAPFGVEYIETRSEAVIGAYATLDMLAGKVGEYDAAIIAAFGDPGIAAAKEIMPIPVVGLTEAGLMNACLLGRRYSIISISRRIVAWYSECVEFNGLSSRLASIRALDEQISDIGKVQDEHGEHLLSLCNAAVQEDGADVIIVAGAPLAGLARSIRDQVAVPIVDCVAGAVRQAESLASMGPVSASAGSCCLPPVKAHKGLSPALSKLIGRQNDD